MYTTIVKKCKSVIFCCKFCQILAAKKFGKGGQQPSLFSTYIHFCFHFLFCTWHFHWQGNNLSLSLSQDSTAVILTFTFPPQNHEQFCYIPFCNIHFHFIFAVLLSDMPNQWTYQRARVLQWYIHKGGSFSHILCLINCQWYTFNMIHTQIQ